MAGKPEYAGRERRRYRKVSLRMHSDEKFLQLSRPQPNGQSLWQYLIYGPHTGQVPGLSSAGKAQLAERLGWTVRGFSAAWKEIEDLGLARADWDRCVIWLPNAIKHNEPESPNVVKSWKEALALIPHCALKLEALAHLEAYLQGIGKAYAEAFREAFPKGLPEAFQKGFRDEPVKASAEALREASAEPSHKASRKPRANQDQEQEQEVRTPQPPSAEGGDARTDEGRNRRNGSHGRRLTRKELSDAEQVRKAWGRCRHDPPCDTSMECIQAIGEERRLKAHGA